LSALKILEVMQTRSAPLSELARIMEVFPQELVAVNVTDKPALETLPEVGRVIAEVESRLGDQGRVLVRYSGTQPVCRVMVEGPDRQMTADCCREIAAVVQRCIGA
ncbi:MAG: phosphoglucosamine mutase, partial [Desulfobacterales bacterium]|nr:phosphoglucosamine mutase [Desulfobacterales bacterium]